MIDFVSRGTSSSSDSSELEESLQTNCTLDFRINPEPCDTLPAKCLNLASIFFWSPFLSFPKPLPFNKDFLPLPFVAVVEALYKPFRDHMLTNVFCWKIKNFLKFLLCKYVRTEYHILHLFYLKSEIVIISALVKRHSFSLFSYYVRTKSRQIFYLTRSLITKWTKKLYLCKYLGT